MIDYELGKPLLPLQKRPISNSIRKKPVSLKPTSGFLKELTDIVDVEAVYKRGNTFEMTVTEWGVEEGPKSERCSVMEQIGSMTHFRKKADLDVL